MDESVRKHFEALLSVEAARLNEQTQRELGKTTSFLTARGNLQSGGAFRVLTDVAARTIQIFAQTAFNIVTRTATAHAIEIRSANQSEIVDLVAAAIQAEVTNLSGMLLDQPSFKGTGMRQMADRFLTELESNADLEITRISTEISLIAVANDRRGGPSQESSSQMIFNGPVGFVQTGPGSFGTAIQHIDGATREHLEKAFSEVLDALGNPAEAFPFDKNEVQELVKEGQDELKKGKPNHTRLKAIVSGVGGAIAYAPKLKAAYDTVRWAATFIGLTLPG